MLLALAELCAPGMCIVIVLISHCGVKSIHAIANSKLSDFKDKIQYITNAFVS